ncbi:MAG: Cof-type HAD-IIB family hydrolase [Treponema sp.]|nr:Cof-type HAD-IIB family hydrolase [Treponema sp.]
MDTIRLIASDMDHTLLTEKGELPPHFNDYISRLDKLGIDFVIASGRSLYNLETMFPEIKHKISFISDNGGVISHKGEIIFTDLLKPADYQAMIRFVEDKTEGIPILCGLNSAFVAAKYKIYEDYLNTFYSKTILVEKLDEVTVDADKFTVYFPHEDSKEHCERVFKPQYGARFSVTTGDAIWIDITNYGVDKGQAIRTLGKELGLKPEQMMAFGDTYNDIEMLQAVKYSYIVRNANADMRQYARFIADSNDNFGVLKVIDQLISDYSTEGSSEGVKN